MDKAMASSKGLWRIVLGIFAGSLMAGPAAALDPPAWLPRYDVEIHLDIRGHEAHVRQSVTWTNHHARPAQELVFNAHSHFQIESKDVPLLAKTLEILRMTPSESMESSTTPPPLQVQRVRSGDLDLPFHYHEANGKPLSVAPQPAIEAGLAGGCEHGTALVVPLPQPIATGQSVTVEIEFTLRLPQKQGRWGQWKGVTFMVNWLPVLAVYDETGWQPTPFVPWHQPFFNEAGLYNVQATLPCEEKIASSSSIQQERDLGNGLKQVSFAPRILRDFAFLCSARYQDHVAHVGEVEVHCLALPEHDHYGNELVRWVCEAIPVYNQWIGPFPYPSFTVAESYFGWNGNECGGLVMIDERVFNFPHVAGPFLEQLVSHELCHQWWYNAIGTNGYCETWMDEAMATHFSNKLMDRKHGRDDKLLNYPEGLGWLPNIDRKTYRNYGLYGSIARGDATATVQEMPGFQHLVTLLSMAYDRGSKIVAMIEDRLGENAFFDFSHRIYERYYFRIIRVADYERELIEYTHQHDYWEGFFKNWIFGSAMCDWAVESVHLGPAGGVELEAAPAPSFLEALRAHKSPESGPCHVTVHLRQKGDYSECTTLGIAFDEAETYSIRVPIDPRAQVQDIQEPPGRVQTLPDGSVQVDLELPSRPTQIAVDPDQILVDTHPDNNFWKMPVRWRFAPVNTPLEETTVTTAYDRLNVIFGPGFQGSAYGDPWYVRSPVVGLRAALYEGNKFDLGTYLGYRTDYQDLVVGVDGLIDHWPWSHTQVGFNAEFGLTPVGGQDNRESDRGVLFGRYVFLYNSSLYLPPSHYIEAFGMVQSNALPLPDNPTSGANHFDQQTALGLHWHLDYETPYWDPEGGFRIDATYAGGIPIFGEQQSFQLFTGEFSQVKYLPDWLGPLSETKIAYRLQGGVAWPGNAQIFTLGGSNLFRGFDLKERQGNMFWIASLEWRVPLIRQVEWDCCDHFAGVRNIYAAAFYDVGNAYLNNEELGPIAHALGVGLRIDIAWLSMIERTTLRFDVAKTVNDNTPWQFWFGVQAPF
jgi:hypothetical protein